MQSRIHTSQLLHILIPQIQRLEIPRLAPLRPHEHTAVTPTLKIPLPLDRPIILARGLIKCDANPRADAGDLGDQADVGHGASAGVCFGEEAHATRECETCCAC